jgi:hypothetical protein
MKRALAVLSLLAVFAIAAVTAQAGMKSKPSRKTPRFNRHAVAAAFPKKGGEAAREAGRGGPEQERYDDRALPGDGIASAQQLGAYTAFLSVAKLPGGKKTNWQEIGPITPFVPGEATYTGRPTTDSGRVTALAVSPNCHANDCKIFAGAAGGGIWEADNALAQKPNWHPSNTGIPSNAIGSLIFDPTDASGKTLYAGTGEPNGSSDSEAGIGLYKSTDFGKSWTLVSGSPAVSKDRSTGAIAIDPVNPNHIFIGTDVARHGSSSVNGGRFTPPGAPPVGLYESTDGGATFALAFSQPSDTVDPTSPNGSDFFRGGVTKIAFDRTGLSSGSPSNVYFSMFDYGLFRSNGSGGYELVFASAGGGLIAFSAGSRTEFALAPLTDGSGHLRVYLGDTNGGPADFYRVDNVLVPAATLTDGVNNPGWTKLSNSTPGTPGFTSWDFCGNIAFGLEQCSYDMPIESPPGQPDVVWIGGEMQYSEIFTAHPPSNGRAVQRSTNAGVSFTDMTNDTLSPPLGMHPDQHAIAFAGSNGDIAFLGSDGGVVRVSGSYVDASGDCSSRGLSGASLTDCQTSLAAIPTRIFSLNDGLATLQFQSVSKNPQNPANDILGGTQDNGTWAYNGHGAGSWFESVGGDGGQSGTNPASSLIRMHTYTGPQGDVNFNGTDPLGWDWFADVLLASHEAASFYAPLINDPKVGGTWFIGLQHVWRTQDNAGPRAYLDLHCNEFFGDFSVPCGDWVTLGTPTLTGAAFGADKGGSYVVAIQRAAGDATGNLLWAGTRLGRIFISKNAAANPSSAVTFTRLDDDSAITPRRFPSSIAVDGNDPYHAYVSFSGYDAYTPTTPGHVFEVHVDPTSPTLASTWTDISYNLGDQPITGIARDDVTGDLFVSTDFGVAMLPAAATTWVPAAGSLPPVAVYGLTIDSNARLLYAATHGRGAWKLDLSK